MTTTLLIKEGVYTLDMKGFVTASNMISSGTTFRCMFCLQSQDTAKANVGEQAGADTNGHIEVGSNLSQDVGDEAWLDGAQDLLERGVQVSQGSTNGAGSVSRHKVS